MLCLFICSFNMFTCTFSLFFLCTFVRVLSEKVGDGELEGCKRGDIMALITNSKRAYEHTHARTLLYKRGKTHVCRKIEHLFCTLLHLSLSAAMATSPPSPLSTRLLFFRYYENGIRCWWTIRKNGAVIIFLSWIRFLFFFWLSLTECICFDKANCSLAISLSKNFY